MLSETGEDEETPKLTNKEREKLLKEMIGIQSDSEEKWICDLCEREQSLKKKIYLFLQHGALCSSCFDRAISLFEAGSTSLSLRSKKYINNRIKLTMKKYHYEWEFKRKGSVF